jgi:phosphate transport system substrate-binding protein
VKKFRFAVAAVSLALAACGGKQGGGQATGGGVGAIAGAGSSFVYPVLAAWSSDYGRSAGKEVNYQSIGSGGGIAQVKAGTVDFGATDKPLDPRELAASGLAQFPIVIGGVVPVVNIAGIEAGRLKLTGPVLADIYAGKVGKWNDPEVTALNPGVALPAIPITIVHRSDSSGTSFNFTHYLSQMSASWRAGPGEGTSVSWPVGVGGKGNDGVAAYVRQIAGSVGYVEYAYVVQNRMAWVGIGNAAGRFVAPSAASFQAAAASADWTHARDFFLVMTNAPGADSWPITAATFVLMHRQPRDKARSDAASAFFRWALENGRGQAQRLDYVPLPAPLVKQVETYIGRSIK